MHPGVKGTSFAGSRTDVQRFEFYLFKVEGFVL